MSGRLSVENPSPPKSRASSVRRPLSDRSDSEINESRQQTPNSGSVEGNGQENLDGAARRMDDKVYHISPFPMLESQVFRPRSGPSATQLARSHLNPLGIEPQTVHYDTNSSATTTPWQHVAADYTPSPPSGDEDLRVSYRGSLAYSQSSGGFRADQELTTPASTVRIVANDTPTTVGYSGNTAGTSFVRDFSSRGTDSATQRYTASPDWSLPSMPPRHRDPSTPTRVSRGAKPTLRTIADLVSEATATPGSTRSANSSGTQVHRHTRNDDEEPPEGSYLHFAERRTRRSMSDSEFASSSPVVQAFRTSSPTIDSPNLSPNDEKVSGRATDLHPSQSSSRRNSSGFPALRRYLEAAESSVRLPSVPSEPLSPLDEYAHEVQSTRQTSRSNAQRWSSIVSLSTIPSMPEGTTAPSSIRVISAEPSNLSSDPELSRLTEDTVYSSIRLVSSEPSNVFDDTETSALTQDSTVQSSIRLVSPETSHTHSGPDDSVLTFLTQSSIRMVEDSPAQREDASQYAPLELQKTPTAQRFPRRVGANGAATMSSPVWVSYSSPAQLPHITDLSGPQSPLESSPGLSQWSGTKSPPDTPRSAQTQEVAHVEGSPSVTNVPYRRKSIRQTSQTSPFFHGSSGRANLRRSTIGQAIDRDQEGQWDTEWLESRAAALNSDSRYLEPLSEDLAPSPTSNASFHTDDTFGQTSAHDSSPMPRPLQFPVASSSINNTPGSIHIPRNRPTDRASRISHIRARTLGSTNSSVSRDSNELPIRSPRRSSSPVRPYNYHSPVTPSDRPTRPSNPTPGVTPGVTPARDRRVRQLYQPTLPEINPSSSAEPISYPSVIHQSSHYQLPGRVGNRDFSPHLWHGATHTVNRRSMFRPPSIDEVQVRFMAGAKARRDLQIACFALGFLMPICWLVASCVPLPNRGNVELVPGVGGRKWKGKSVIGDVEKFEGYNAFTADEVAGYESARWWRGMNRCLSIFGIGIAIVFIVLGVVSHNGGIQV